MDIVLVDVSDEFQDEIPGFVFDIQVPALERIVGRVEYRFETGLDLLYYGHVGYVIYLPYRGHRFAEKACRAMAVLLKEKHPEIKSMMITCNPDNEASKRTIENLGAVFIQHVYVAKEHELYEQGDTEKNVYEWIF